MTRLAVHHSLRRRWACRAVIALVVGAVAAVVSWPAGALASARGSGVSVIGQVPDLFAGKLTVTNDFLTKGGGRSDKVDTTTTYNLQMQLQGTSSPTGTFYQWFVVPASSTWHITYNETATDDNPPCTTTGVAEAGGNFVNAPDLTLMQQFDNGLGPDIETSTGYFKVKQIPTCGSAYTETDVQGGYFCQHQDDTPINGTVHNAGTRESVTWDYTGTTTIVDGETETCSMKGTLTGSACVPPDELSGPDWVNQFPDSKKVADLSGAFRQDVTSFISAMQQAGITVSVVQTLRPPERAYLMHYSWLIVKGKIDPKNVPKFTPAAGQLPVDICWVHTKAGGAEDLPASVAAAQQMVSAYHIDPNLTVAPALTSLHTKGLAIDMKTTWTQPAITIADNSGNPVTINTTPRSGLNTHLMAVGLTYGVHHFCYPAGTCATAGPGGDANHWSATGH